MGAGRDAATAQRDQRSAALSALPQGAGAARVAVTDALGFEVRDCVELVLGPGAAMAAGPCQHIGNRFADGRRTVATHGS